MLSIVMFIFPKVVLGDRKRDGWGKGGEGRGCVGGGGVGCEKEKIKRS